MTDAAVLATSENLRKLARLIEMDQPLHGQAVSEAIVLCTTAWEADRLALSQQTARIETLEDDLTMDKLWPWVKASGEVGPADMTEARFFVGLVLAKVRKVVHAALAAQEKKP